MLLTLPYQRNEINSLLVYPLVSILNIFSDWSMAKSIINSRYT